MVERSLCGLRLRGISSLAAGNADLPEFIVDFNARFAVVPRAAVDAHRPLLPQDHLERILTVQDRRTLSKNLTLNYQNVIYQIQTARPTYALRQAQVVVREDRFGAITLAYKGKPLTYTVYRKPAKQGAVTSSKQLNAAVDRLTVSKTKKRKIYVPPPDPPWRHAPINPKSPPPAVDPPG